MVRGPFSDEFVAMIPAHQEWAESIPPIWHYPLIAIVNGCDGGLNLDRFLGQTIGIQERGNSGITPFRHSGVSIPCRGMASMPARTFRRDVLCRHVPNRRDR